MLKAFINPYHLSLKTPLKINKFPDSSKLCHARLALRQLDEKEIIEIFTQIYSWRVAISETGKMYVHVVPPISNQLTVIIPT